MKYSISPPADLTQRNIHGKRIIMFGHITSNGPDSKYQLRLWNQKISYIPNFSLFGKVDVLILYIEMIDYYPVDPLCYISLSLLNCNDVPEFPDFH